jgi:hypothetical protein
MYDYNLLDIGEVINYIFNLCKKKILLDNEIKDINNIFGCNIINPNYNNGYFLIVSAINGNYYMIDILKKYGCDIYINDNEALRICAQNNFFDCALLLYNETINIDDYIYSASYENLLKIVKIVKNRKKS